MNQTENVDKVKSEIYHPLHWGKEFYVSGMIQFQRERKNVMDGSKTDTIQLYQYQNSESICHDIIP